jgi:hypothetical protein
MTTQLCIACGMLLALAAAEVWATESIYRCAEGGRTVLTDRPTDPAACQPLNAPASNTYIAPTVTHSPRTAAVKVIRTSKQDESIAAEQLKTKQRCERIEQRLDQIASKMRSGYTVRQGEKLREQREQLEATRRIERCR